ncbi:hypothetical protein [Rossellomorea sp. LJF3]|uniref:hypothetical protein n=1 Tax=Rossellomorea sp. LJF3 TaxID=3126099 RepID=UPI00300C14CC
MKKKLVLFILALFLTFPMTSLANSSKANSQANKVGIEKQAENYFDNLDIKEKNKQKVLKKIKSGKLLNADNPDKYTPEVIEELTVDMDEPVKEYTFEDGSKVRVSAVPGPQRVINCGSGYCAYDYYLIKREAFNTVAEFRADFTIVQGDSEPDYIRHVYDASVSYYPGYVEDYNLLVNRATEYVYGGGEEAKATLYFTCISTGGTASFDAYLRLVVGNDGFSVVPSGNWYN